MIISWYNIIVIKKRINKASYEAERVEMAQTDTATTDNNQDTLKVRIKALEDKLWKWEAKKDLIDLDIQRHTKTLNYLKSKLI